MLTTAKNDRKTVYKTCFIYIYNDMKNEKNQNLCETAKFLLPNVNMQCTTEQKKKLVMKNTNIQSMRDSTIFL